MPVLIRRVRKALVLVSLLWSPVWAADQLVSAEFAEPTSRYGHAVLGDVKEWGALRLRVSACSDCDSTSVREVVVRLPESRVFEDLEPRIVALNAASARAAMVVESDALLGARLALYNADGLIAATPFIGTRYRWLAPIGAADLDGDGVVEFAYIDRPHLAKTLRVWRLVDGSLIEVASARGYSNHRIGWDYIEGGLRDCGDGVEMVVASGDWRDVTVLRFDGALHPRVIADYSPDAMRLAMACEIGVGTASD